MPTTWVTDRLRTVRSWWHAHDAAVWDRVVQEGLTNAVKYATGQPTEVHATHRDGRIEVAVTSSTAPVTVGAGRALSGGRGLTGPRERVTTLGGGLTAGEQPDGRFRVHAVIPIAGDA
jgi:signal transduction histidine kinase